MDKKKLYAAIDLHSVNNFLAVVDEKDHRLYEKRLKNELSLVLAALEPFKEGIHAIAVESTFNWYWLVDGLQNAGYRERRILGPGLQRSNPWFSVYCPGTPEGQAFKDQIEAEGSASNDQSVIGGLVSEDIRSNAYGNRIDNPPSAT